MIPHKKGDRWAPLRTPKPAPEQPPPRVVHFDIETHRNMHDEFGQLSAMDFGKLERHVLRSTVIGGAGAPFNWQSNPFAAAVFDPYDTLRMVMPVHGWYRAPPRSLRKGVRILRGGKWGTITEALQPGKENRHRFVVLPLTAGDTLVGVITVKSSSYVTFDPASIPEPAPFDPTMYLK